VAPGVTYAAARSYVGTELGRRMAMTGKWDHLHAGVETLEPYGATVTYELGARFLADCDLVEDWGCGKGWMRRHVPPGQYRGIDGSRSPFADVTADLTDYRSTVPGVFMRHVLEHNYDWRAVLDNAIASFTQRLVVVLFTPLVDETHEIAFVPDPGVPDIAFALGDLTGPIGAAGAAWSTETIETATHYGTETVIYAEKP